MKIDFPKDESDKAIGVLMALRKAVPIRGAELGETLRQCKHGITIEVNPLEFRHTDPQRRYYHLWKRAFAEFCGNTPDEMHEHLLCEAFGSEYTRTRLGLMRRPLQRSSTANIGDYSVLIDTLTRVAAEMGFHVPPPHTGA